MYIIGEVSTLKYMIYKLLMYILYKLKITFSICTLLIIVMAAL